MTLGPARLAALLVALVGGAGCGAPAPPPLALTPKLSQAGLYASIADKRVVDEALPFTPAHKLWSDGAQKQRWVLLPRGTQIDTSDPDRWTFPVGTRFFKEFALDGKRLETRLVLRVAGTGDPDVDYQAGAYVWLDDESDAVLTLEGANDVRGTDHDVPAGTDCWRCHNGEPGRSLGFSATQLADSEGPTTLALLAARGLLSRPVVAAGVPGSDGEKAALGWLHANCGHCHNEYGNAWGRTSMVLRVGAGETAATATRLYQTTVGVPLQYWVPPASRPDLTVRIAPGQPDGSALVYRDAQRGTMDQMPPLATEIIDPDGAAAVRAWITSLR